jgi:hypothetical protein
MVVRRRYYHMIIATHGILSPFSGSTVFSSGVLDSIGVTSPSGAWSLRRLKIGYTGNAALVRRSSDNTTQDIGFDTAGKFDTAAFSAFIGAGSGYCQKLYDQSGSGRDFVQTTNANQPQIVLNAIGSTKPALYFTGTQYMNVASSAGTTWFRLNASDSSFNALIKPGIVADPNNLYGICGNNAGATRNYGFHLRYEDRAAASVNDGYVISSSAGDGTNANIIVSDVRSNVLPAQTWSVLSGRINFFTIGDNSHLTDRDTPFVNLTEYASTSNNSGNSGITPNTATMTDLQLGAVGSNAFPFVGYIAELFLNTATMSTPTLQAFASNQNSYYTIF